MIRKVGVCLFINDTMIYIQIKIGWQNIASVYLVGCDLWVLAVYSSASYIMRKMHY